MTDHDSQSHGPQLTLDSNFVMSAAIRGLPGVSPRGTVDPPRHSRSSVAVRIARRKAPEGPRAIRTATGDLECRRRWIARLVPRQRAGPREAHYVNPPT